MMLRREREKEEKGNYLEEERRGSPRAKFKYSLHLSNYSLEGAGLLAVFVSR
jgi:hypothetical protein